MVKEKEYHKRPEWSYSQMKVILDSGIDFAVAKKRGMLPPPTSKAIDFGELIHTMVLGGESEVFSVSPYSDFRTKDAREWKADQIANGQVVVSKDQYDTFAKIVENVGQHPLARKLIYGKGVKHEVELYGKANGVDLRGKADAILVDGDSLIITDLKTTAQFDEWKYKAMRRHYDLQAATYSLIGNAATGTKANRTNFYFCVAETVPPFRVQFHHASLEFVERGEQKLAKCLEEIKEFGDKDPKFVIEEVNELGDFSL